MGDHPRQAGPGEPYETPDGWFVMDEHGRASPVGDADWFAWAMYPVHERIARGAAAFAPFERVLLDAWALGEAHLIVEPPQNAD